MNNKTIREFSFSTNIWPLVDEWAKQTGYGLKKSSKSRRVYVKGGLFEVPVLIDICQQDGQVQLQAWIRQSMLPISVNLLISAETGLESGGVVMEAPRSIGRTTINELLGRFAQSPIM